jgi:hypothetical protein
MSDQEILEKAIQKAIDGGWTVGRQIKFEKSMGWVQVGDGPEEPEVTENGVTARMTQLLGETDILYDKGFAKALWGDKFFTPVIRDDTGTTVGMIKQTPWKHHLRQMVIAEDPIKYLGENL